MAEKKSILIHLDSLEVLDHMTDQEAGKLFKAIKADRTGQEIEIPKVIKFAFAAFKSQFARDDINYLKTVERNTKNGAKGGRPKEPNETQKTHSDISEPKKPDSKNKKDNDSDKGTKKEIQPKVRNIVAKTPLPEYSPCLKFWLEDFHLGWTFTGAQGNALNSIIKKFRKILKDKNQTEPAPADVVESFKVMCRNLPEWHRDKDLNILDQKFNEIIQKIKDGESNRQIGRNTKSEIENFLATNNNAPTLEEIQNR